MRLQIQHQGMTDLWIVDVLLAKRGVPEGTIKERLPAINAAMVDYCQARRDQIGVSLLPGVRALLAELAGREDTLLGLVTGNLEPIAHMKLAASGLGGAWAVWCLKGPQGWQCLHDACLCAASF